MLQRVEERELVSDGFRWEASRALTCVIVAYHRPADVAKLVQGLTDPRIQVVVVNVENDPQVRTVQCDTMVAADSNIGFAAAVNRGVAAAGSGVVVFMNDDVVASAKDVWWLAQRVLKGQADVAVPLVTGQDGRLELGSRVPLGLARRMLLKGMPVPSQPIEIDAAWAPMVAVRTELVRMIPVPEDYFLYWEEFDWFYQLRKRGARVELNPLVRIKHLGGPDTVRPDKSRLLARNAVRCVSRTRGRGAAVRAWPVVCCWQMQLLTRSLMARRASTARAHAAGVWAALGAWREL
jgi:GT2 family glycosyltransferase